MKTTVIFFLCLVSIGYTDSIEYVDTLQLLLEESKSLSGFIEKVEGKKYEMPLIYSLWHIDTYKGGDNQYYKVSEFGESLLDRMNEEQHILINSNYTAKDKLSQIKILYRMAEWFTSTGGYGNYLLSKHAFSSIGKTIGRFIVNEEFALDTLDNMISELEKSYRSSISIQYVFGTLENELPEGIFKDIPSNAAYSNLADIFNVGFYVYNGKRTGLNITYKDISKKQRESVSKKGLKAIHKHSAFFKENAGDFDASIKDIWSLKIHRRIGFSSHNHQLKYLKALIVFKAAIGYFPDSKEIFGREWRMYLARKHNLPDYRMVSDDLGALDYTYAWTAYELIKANKYTFSFDNFL